MATRDAAGFLLSFISFCLSSLSCLLFVSSSFTLRRSSGKKARYSSSFLFFLHPCLSSIRHSQSSLFLSFSFLPSTLCDPACLCPTFLKRGLLFLLMGKNEYCSAEKGAVTPPPPSPSHFGLQENLRACVGANDPPPLRQSPEVVFPCQFLQQATRLSIKWGRMKLGVYVGYVRGE